MEEKKTKTQKRLVLNIPESFHHKVKARASFKNISMRTWVIRAIIKAMQEEDKYMKNE